MADDQSKQMPAADRTVPLRHLFAVVPSDLTDLAIVPRAILVGVAGNVTLRMVDDVADTVIFLAAGVFHPIQVKRIYATGTAASAIIGGY